MRIVIFIIGIISTLFIYGCGTTNSLNSQNAVKYAVVNVTDSLHVTGRLLEIDSTKITIAVNGSSYQYQKTKILGYKIINLPDERLVNEEQLRNSSRAATNTGIFVGVIIISAFLALIIPHW